ncbi:beta strand repeat-containing protein [Novosphingobium bradum]|uniref:Beta strand repeat-containing protein n=1 Tax=Novosphingobium bradum TaxID=1737444 RepID=A0ABV7INR2_9SPHN
MPTITGTNGNDTLIGTTAADSFLPLLGLDWLSGGLGFDTLTVNYAALLGITASIAAESAGAFAGAIGNALVPAANRVTFSGIEALALTFSPGNDTATIDAAPLAAGATLQLDAGAGFDVLRIDFSALADTTFQQGVNFLVTSNRGSFSGWDQFEITLGPGANRVTTQTGADAIHAAAGNDTISTGAGNDTIWSAGGIDVVNGGAGTDLWHGDYSGWSSALGFAYDTSAGTGYVTNGTTLTQIEGGSILTGSAEDSFLLMGLGAFHVDGGLGEDWLTWDDTGDLGTPYAASFENGGTGQFAGTVARATFAGIEHINAALGDGDNSAFVDAAPLALGATMNLSGGLGFDSLAVDFSAFAGTTFVVGADGTIAANRGTWLDFEQFFIAVGAGANTVTTGAGDDAAWSAGGADAIDLGAGFDQWEGDYSAAATALSFTWDGNTGAATLSNGTTLAHAEYADLTTGAGDDSFVMSGLLSADIHAGAGVDSLQRNDAGLAAAYRDVAIFAAGSAFQGLIGFNAFDGIEQLALTLSDDDNVAYVNAAPLLAGATLTLDGGAGADWLQLDLSTAPGALLATDAAGVITGDRGTYRGFEAVWIGLGSGANTITTGSGNDTVEAAHGGANRIATGAGDDLVIGGPGAETVDGGAGADLFVVSGRQAGHALTQDGLGGYILTDIDPTDGDDGVDRLTAVEQVRFADGSAALPAYAAGVTLTGTAGADTLSGTPWADRLSGLAGNDSLDGSLGDDWLSGGPGDDRLTGGGGVDTVDYADAPALVKISLAITGKAQATGGAGNDWLVDAIENLTGSAFADTLTGNALANRIEGAAGNDAIDGGAGADTLLGGLGNDTYTVDNAADEVLENAGEGTDLVKASASFTLSANVENLTLTGALAIDGTGNALANSLVGNTAANRLTGMEGNDTLDGAAGADTLVGGLGNDVYKVDNAGDQVLENAGEGTDLVSATITAILAANIENLTLAGTLAIDGTGNGLANSLVGNAAANRLTGLDGNDTLDGAAGADTLAGGLGNDTYKVDNAGDLVIEAAGEGTDLVSAAVTFTLAPNVENLTLTGTLAITGTGNTQANSLIGNAAANLLSGLAGNDTLNGGGGDDTLAGGAGADTLTGGAGADTFLFDLRETAALRDVIQDFAHLADHLAFDRAAFTPLAALPAGALDPAQLALGTAATTAQHHFVYTQATGSLYFDADGAGGTAQALVATLTTKPILSAADFLLI